MCMLKLALLFLSLFVGHVLGQGAYRGHDHSIAVRRLGPEGLSRGYNVLPVSLPLPAYPVEMLRAAISGDATLKFLVHEDGAVSEVVVISASQVEFSGPTKEAISRWKFRVHTERGESAPRKVWMRCQVIFKFEED